MDKVKFSPKAQKFGCTKQTPPYGITKIIAHVHASNSAIKAHASEEKVGL